MLCCTLAYVHYPCLVPDLHERALTPQCAIVAVWTIMYTEKTYLIYKSPEFPEGIPRHIRCPQIFINICRQGVCGIRWEVWIHDWAILCEHLDDMLGCKVNDMCNAPVMSESVLIQEIWNRKRLYLTRQSEAFHSRSIMSNSSSRCCIILLFEVTLSNVIQLI